MAKNILSCDLGGTSARFGHFSGSNTADLILEKTIWLKTKDASSFVQLLQLFEENSTKDNFKIKLSDYDIFSVAVAGPVEDGVRSVPPNIPWTIDIEEAHKQITFPKTILMNDFVGQAYSAVSPLAKKAKVILAGVPKSSGTIAVVGAGTGLGKGIVVPMKGDSYLALPSEGGHASFSPENKREAEFADFLKDKGKVRYACWDEIVSGRGLSTIHEFLTGEVLSPQDVTKGFSSTSETQDSETLEWAARFYGRVCRNFALEILALGGFFIAGGIAIKNPMLLTHPAFADEFRNPRAHKHLFQEIPVSLIEDEESGLWGAAFAGMQAIG
jgi:glucokinase